MSDKFEKYAEVCEAYEKAWAGLTAAYEHLAENDRRWFKTPEQVHGQLNVKRSAIPVINLSGSSGMIKQGPQPVPAKPAQS